MAQCVDKKLHTTKSPSPPPPSPSLNEGYKNTIIFQKARYQVLGNVRYLEVIEAQGPWFPLALRARLHLG
jgi:hypothetical protein